MTDHGQERDLESTMKKLAASALAFLLTAGTWAVQGSPVGVILEVEGTVRVVSGDADPVDAAVGTRVSSEDRIVPESGGRALLVLRGGDRVEIGQAYTVPSPGTSSGDDDAFSRVNDVMGRVASMNRENLADRQGMIRPIPGEPVPVEPRNELTVLSIRPTFTWHGVQGTTGYTVQIRRPGSAPVRFQSVDDTTFTYPADAPPLIPGEEYWWTVAPEGSGRATREQRFSVIGADAYARIAGELRSLADSGLDPAGDGAFMAAVLFRNAGLYYAAEGALSYLERSGAPMSADAYLMKGEILATLGKLEGARAAFDRADAMRP